MGHLCGDCVGRDGDQACAAEREDGEGEAVVAGEDFKADGDLGDELCDLGEVAAGFLDADDVGESGQAGGGGGLEVDAGARRNVVEQDG